MKPDPSIEECERLAQMADERAVFMEAREQARMWNPNRPNDWRTIAATLRAPTRAPEEGTRIEGLVWRVPGGNVWFHAHDDNHNALTAIPTRCTILLYASVTVDGEVTE